ncbi:MAG: HlyD family secretion protein, partial [bacterium]
MDRPIEASVIEGRKRRGVIAATFGAAFLLALGLLLPGWVRPSVERGRLITARVGHGSIDVTLSASGVVSPLIERTITAPGASRVLRVLKQAGDSVAAGEPILELDNGASRLEVERLTGQMAVKANEREQARVDQDNRLSELKSQLEIKKLELQSKEFDVERNRKLHDLGVISGDVLRQSQTDAGRLRIEIEALTRRTANAERALAVQLQSLDLEYEIRTRERDEAARVLTRGMAASDMPGIITWVLGSEGAAVNQGDELARVADLGRFKVEATLADVYSGRIRPGQATFVVAGTTRLTGYVSRVLPTVSNGTIGLEIALDEPSHPALRQNLRVEAHLVVDRREDALRLARGSILTEDDGQYVFVVRGGRAVRTRVRFGLTGWDAAEVLEGLVDGDEVILSDMSDHP